MIYNKKLVEYFKSIKSQEFARNFVTFDTATISHKIHKEPKIRVSNKNWFVIDKTKYKTLTIKKNLYNNNSIVKDYDFNLYCKNEIANLNNKEEIIKTLIIKSNIQQTEFIDCNFYRQDIYDILSINELANIINADEDPKVKKYIKDNYKTIIEQYFKSNLNKIDVIKMISEYVFDKSSFYYRNLVNTITNALSSFLRTKNIYINYKLLQYILENVLVYKNKETFGVMYQTISHISKNTGISRFTVMQHIRKLEYIGILSGVVSDIKRRNYDMHKYVSEIETIEDKNVKSKIADAYKEQEYYNGYFVFPFVNFDILMNFIPDYFIEDMFKNCLYEIKHNISVLVLDKFVEEIVVHGINKESIKNIITNNPAFKEIMDKPSIDASLKVLDKKYIIQFSPYNEYLKFKDLATIDLNKAIEVNNNFEEYFKNKTGEFNLVNIIEDSYILSKWMQDNLKLVYESVTTKQLKVVDKNKMFKFAVEHPTEFIRLEDEIFDNNLTWIYRNDREVNLKHLFKHLMENYRLGIIELVKKKLKMKFNSFKVYQNKALQETIDKNKNITAEIGNWWHFRNIIKKYKPKTTFGLYDIIKEKYLELKQPEDKIQFIFKLYEIFVKVNKNPSYILWNILKVIE